MRTQSADTTPDRVPESHGAESATYTSSSSSSTLDDLCFLNILRFMADTDVVQLRAVSKGLCGLADLVLEQSFQARWGVREVAAPATAAPAYAATKETSFVLCHKLEGRETLATIAVRYKVDPITLRRINNILSETALPSRSHLYVPVPDAAAAAAGKRVAFLHDEHSKRRLVAIIAEGQDLPDQLEGTSAAAAAASRQRARNQEFVVAKLAAVLQRALHIDQPTAAYYVQSAGCDIREAMAKFQDDQRWERVRKRHGS